MINITDKSKCCGCTACSSICTHDAITMEPDSLGFLYPVVNTSKCVNCGLCDKVCAFKSEYDKSLNLSFPIAYAVRHKNMKEIETSRSGAAFIALSDVILDMGGAVYGAGFKDHFRVAHKKAITKTERDEFKGSKYVQSDLSGVFRQVKEDLKNNLIVLFSGTPCQTSGLRSFIPSKFSDKLYLIDIVCHGVPSPYIWRDYIDYLEHKTGMTVTTVNFRDKSREGWSSHVESFIYNNNNNNTYSTYSYLFYQHISFRHSCSKCPFTNLKRPSDITIADYWGWERTDPEFNKDNKGCSLVLCNTHKGMEWFKKASIDLNIRNAEIKNIMQPHLSSPMESHPKRELFEKYYIHHGFEKTMNHFGMMGWRHVLKNQLKRIKYLIQHPEVITKKIAKYVRVRNWNCHISQSQ